MISSPVIDLIIRIKNGYAARREVIDSPHSKFREAVLKKLVTRGYLKSYEISPDKRSVKIELSYDGGAPAVTDVKIYSKPGRRVYITVNKIKPVLGGLGIGFLSTPKGILTTDEAKKQKIAGELLFDIW